MLNVWAAVFQDDRPAQVLLRYMKKNSMRGGWFFDGFDGDGEGGGVQEEELEEEKAFSGSFAVLPTWSRYRKLTSK